MTVIKSQMANLPLNWEVDTMSYGIDLISGQHILSDGVNSEAKGVPYITGPANFPNGLIYTDKYALNPRSVCMENDILVTVKGSGTGKIILADRKYAISRQLMAIRVKTDWDHKYLFYLLQAHASHFSDSSTGLIPGISREDILNLEIVLPSNKTEQTTIANALSDIDALIRSLENLIVKKRTIKQGVIQELLQPKKEWKAKKLEEVADSKVKWSFIGGPFGSNLKSSDYTAEGIRVIQLQNIGDGTFINDSEIYTSADKANELLSNNIYPGDIILSKMGDPVARACIIPNFHRRYLMCSDGIRLCVDKLKYNSYFIYSYINSPLFRNKAENASTGSTRKRIGLTELRNLEILCPSLLEQNKVAQILMDIDQEITIVESKLSKYRHIKSGMMQTLLTGQIRFV